MNVWDRWTSRKMRAKANSEKKTCWSFIVEAWMMWSFRERFPQFVTRCYCFLARTFLGVHDLNVWLRIRPSSERFRQFSTVCDILKIGKVPKLSWNGQVRCTFKKVQERFYQKTLFTVSCTFFYFTWNHYSAVNRALSVTFVDDYLAKVFFFKYLKIVFDHWSTRKYANKLNTQKTYTRIIVKMSLKKMSKAVQNF